MVLLDILKVSLFTIITITFTLGAREKAKRIVKNQSGKPTPENKWRALKDYNESEVDLNINKWKRGDKNNVEEYSGLFDGDMMLTEKQMKNFGSSTAWTDADVPYLYSCSQFTKSQKDVINAAMHYVAKNSNVRFLPYTSSHVNYTVFTSEYKGCWSYVGMHKNGQIVNLQKPNCLQLGTIVHVLLHNLGFYHEHNLHSRYKWINLKEQNIDKKKRWFFNKTYLWDDMFAYDYDSIMHGGAYLFSVNENKTMETRIEAKEIGQRKRFSSTDTRKMARFYSINRTTTATTTPKTTTISTIKSTIMSMTPESNADGCSACATHPTDIAGKKNSKNSKSAQSKTLNMLCLLWPLTLSEKCSVP